MLKLDEYFLQKEKENDYLDVINFFKDGDSLDKEEINDFLKEKDIDKSEFDKVCYELLKSFFCAGMWKNSNFKTIDNEEELTKGIQVELEHTNNPILAEKIALDHLTEFENYYSYLAVLEMLMDKKVSIKKLKDLL